MRISSLIFFGFGIIITLTIIDSYVNYMLSQKVNQNTVFLTNSEAVIRNSSKLHKGIIDMQSAFRGFLLTDDSTFLKSYQEGVKTIPELFKEQEKLISSSSTQELRLDSISSLHLQWIGYANALIAAKKAAIKNQGSATYDDLFENKLKKQVGKRLNDQISEMFKEFDRFEYMRREVRRNQLTASIERTKTSSLIFILLTIGVGLICSFYIVRLISRRIAKMVNLAESISNGQFILVNDTKNDELTSLSKSLNTMSQTLSKNIRELEKRNTELNQFAYVVSHDLKAPIRGIYNVVQWIEEDLEGEISPQMRKYLSIIPERINRMEDLIHGLLDYARIGRDKPNKETVDLNLLLKGIIELLVPKDYTVRMEKMPVLYTEKIRLEQVFSNLISNAVKYTPPKNGKIKIGYKELKDAFEFTVSDNGIGIDPKYNEKIFEIFQTLREKHDKESTGIGLAIVKRIIDDQHSMIKVISKPGEGATFVFTWPK